MAEVLHAAPEGQSYLSSSPLRRSSHSSSSLLSSYSSHCKRKPKYYEAQDVERAPSSFPNSRSSMRSPPPVDVSSSTLAPASTATFTLGEDVEDDDDIIFPAYTDANYLERSEDLEPPPSPRTENSYTVPSSTSNETTPTNTPDAMPISEDDTAIRPEPSRHVDYLSHDWREEDIWSSWKHIVSKRKLYGERSRLENASWRTWAKQKHKLRTVAPESLNWLKDCDVTWLYGPLQTASSHPLSQLVSEPPSNLSKTNSFLNKKPILKKRSASEVMLQKSISTSSLVKQAAAAVQAQQNTNSSAVRIKDRPPAGRTTSDFSTSSIASNPASREATDYFSSQSTSGLQTPADGERKHIRFDDKVEQCIAVEIKDGDYDDDDEEGDRWTSNRDSDDSSDDGGVMMKKSKKKREPSQLPRRNSFLNGESKTIAKLPSTTLKYRTDSPDVPDTLAHQSHSFGGMWRSGRLSPSPSQETLRPSYPSAYKFIADEEDDESDISWEPSGAFADRSNSAADAYGAPGTSKDGHDQGLGGLKRTSSGLLAPHEENGDDVLAPGLLGKVENAVNTAKDIAHVIWNVGWKSS